MVEVISFRPRPLYPSPHKRLCGSQNWPKHPTEFNINHIFWSSKLQPSHYTHLTIATQLCNIISHKPVRTSTLRTSSSIQQWRWWQYLPPKRLRSYHTIIRFHKSPNYIHIHFKDWYTYCRQLPQILLVPSTHATCFGHYWPSSGTEFMIFKTQNKMHIY